MATVWFCLVSVMLAAYVVLDGFDLGAGIVHLCVARTREERRTVIASIGPVWDGNEVWLLAAGGGMLVSGALLAPAPMHLFGGFVLCLIYALGAHMLPRFTGRPIRGGAWSLTQLACADAGVALFALGALFAGGALVWSSLLIFALRLWPVLQPFSRA